MHNHVLPPNASNVDNTPGLFFDGDFLISRIVHVITNYFVLLIARVSRLQVKTRDKTMEQSSRDALTTANQQAQGFRSGRFLWPTPVSLGGPVVLWSCGPVVLWSCCPVVLLSCCPVLARLHRHATASSPPPSIIRRCCISGRVWKLCMTAMEHEHICTGNSEGLWNSRPTETSECPRGRGKRVLDSSPWARGSLRPERGRVFIPRQGGRCRVRVCRSNKELTRNGSLTKLSHKLYA
ncbi:hypothetical protein SODALDRAFT_209930 [Sodiomyces alkalinus F11]|uniref:Uncharacterized protein n=1 Tax=Sodiomyces alkalinus (strain CBS 110278 / VKM F-3762 / F11) TaxID=1314773 RepID=A0A3N2PQW5_SODAK|nr:hypothetical protein SODALDRAFT_209930 [Sodiomyces alkalinus F11]ROT36901.1 hypothetical protein SODALDRAFT_209930 [Sodiomyces alkalinus F11]